MGAHALALVPCCMPPKAHAKKEAVYQLGGHSFAAADYRDFIKMPNPKSRFHAWVENVEKTLTPGPDGEQALEEIIVGASATSRQGHDKGEAYSQDLHIF